MPPRVEIFKVQNFGLWRHPPTCMYRFRTYVCYILQFVKLITFEILSRTNVNDDAKIIKVLIYMSYECNIEYINYIYILNIFILHLMFNKQDFEYI